MKQFGYKNKRFLVAAFFALAIFPFTSCKKVGNPINAEGFGGTDALKLTIRSARSAAIEVLKDIRDNGYGVDFCRPRFCPTGSDSCSLLNILETNSDKKNLVIDLLDDTRNLGKMIAFLETAEFDIYPEVYANGDRADARIHYGNKDKVDFSISRLSGKPIGKLIQVWIHEALHTFIPSGFVSVIKDFDDVGEGFLGFELADTAGGCIETEHARTIYQNTATRRVMSDWSTRSMYRYTSQGRQVLGIQISLDTFSRGDYELVISPYVGHCTMLDLSARLLLRDRVIPLECTGPFCGGNLFRIPRDEGRRYQFRNLDINSAQAPILEVIAKRNSGTAANGDQCHGEHNPAIGSAGFGIYMTPLNMSIPQVPSSFRPYR